LRKAENDVNSSDFSRKYAKTRFLSGIKDIFPNLKFMLTRIDTTKESIES
jgi:hypothetical protein